MAKANQNPHDSPSSVELIGARLQKIINSPAAQQSQAAIIYKAPDELQEDWNQIVDAISEAEGICVTFLDDGSARISWGFPAPQ